MAIQNRQPSAIKGKIDAIWHEEDIEDLIQFYNDKCIVLQGGKATRRK